jgi:ribosomal protein S12 methylthiotransferase accessory factor
MARTDMADVAEERFLSEVGKLDVVRRDVESLVSPYGVVSGVWEMPGLRGLDRVSVHCAMVGSAWPGLIGPEDTYGCGRAVDSADLARFISIAEAAERSAAFLSIDGVETRMGDLAGKPIDMSSIPRCSDREYARADCPLRPFDPEVPIRWVKGLELVSMEERWVPAVMAHYGIHSVTEGERFWNGISTGYALYTDPIEAIVRGACEIIERDMIALTWHQMLRLPKLVVQAPSEQLRYLMKWSEEHFIETYLFDATSDMGVPTVYCLQRAPFDERAQHVVGAATERTLAEAAFKALLEAMLVRLLCYDENTSLRDLADFRSVDDGVRYMGIPERASAFDFLTDEWDERATHTEDSRASLPEDSSSALDVLVNRFAAKGIEAVVVDSTPVEIRQAGLSAVSVIIPALQPMSLVPTAQYFGHRRLYEAPRIMGFECRAEEDLNPWPQPFA